ncbi:HAD family hydrolase [Paralimibaculum aggregatum]|uniref:HAD family hydrolase n=1 Tax=Paralimibaculum aggregatum TaxID=3036245 RepID=A0ABQ6LJ69_9RHOB|nr:HAD-IA family hydrolase [Limibaculum sp. NKW23]GMG83327.1 HAD family hydrolase [Limibaculum sp. NKW23]
MLKLVIFDVDGTLVDSQTSITAAMAGAFAAMDLPAPPREAVLGIVGLSLPEAMAVLSPELPEPTRMALVQHYKDCYHAQRIAGGGEAEAAFYPGAREAIDRLDAAGYLLGIATGKARRGLDHILGTHGLAGRFLATQTADDAPSKPAPAMVFNCLAATGVAAEHAVVVGDTEYDMAMARAAGVRALGVGWGYHRPERLVRGGAEAVLESFDRLDGALEALWGERGVA